MDDRELLEMAAKAAGVHWNLWDYDRVRNLGHMVTPNMMWNPLRDDGKAFQLAVNLKLQVIIYSDWVEVLQDGIRKANADSVYDAGCMLTCARRAIVRAAAEIGRAM